MTIFDGAALAAKLCAIVEHRCSNCDDNANPDHTCGHDCHVFDLYQRAEKLAFGEKHPYRRDL